MRRLSRLRYCLLAGAVCFMVMSFHVTASPRAEVSYHGDDSSSIFDHSPVSEAVLMARAITQGRIHLSNISTLIGSSFNRIGVPPTLDCTPIPCAVPNQQASEGGMPVNDT